MHTQRHDEEQQRLHQSCFDNQSVTPCRQLFDLSERTCERDSDDRAQRAQACLDAGTILQKRLAHGDRSPYRALVRLDRACLLGQSNGCQSAGVLCEEDTGIKDLKLARSYYERGCLANHKLACHNATRMKVMLSDSENLTKSDIDVLECDREKTGCNLLGFIAENNHGPPGLLQQDDAAKYYLEACDSGDSTGCYNLGRLYETGLPGRRPDYPSAHTFYKRACEPPGANALGCTAMALLYQERRVPAPPGSRSVDELLESGCDNGNGVDVACFHLALRLKGVSDEARRAERLLEHLCKKPYRRACTELVTLYQNKLDQHTLCDAGNARANAQSLCEQENDVACSLFVQLLQQCRDPQDSASHVKILGSMCKRGNERACALSEKKEAQQTRHTGKKQKGRLQ